MKKNEDKFQEFQNKFPNLFNEYPRSGFYLNEGWTSLVENLCSVLECHIAKLPEEQRSSIYCAQVKSKFGSLRFYMNKSDSYIDGAIAMAETLSGLLCEKCGGVGQRRSGGWVSTMCDNCFQLSKEHST